MPGLRGVVCLVRGRGWCAWSGGGGVSGSGGWSVPGPGGRVCLGYHHPPPVNRITNRCKNITLATTSLRPVITNPWCIAARSMLGTRSSGRST